MLLAEAMALLGPAPGRRFLDATLGLGGHSEALLAAGAVVVGIERDAEARAIATARLSHAADRFTVVAGDFAATAEHVAARGETFDGVLVDLGVSSLQLDDHARGFSLRAEARLDLRMDTSAGETALDLIDRLDERELADVIYRYGEERLSRPIARRIKVARSAGQLETAAQLAEIVRWAVRGHQQRHPALRTFQALRIAVNDELSQLDRLLAVLPRLVAPGGTAALISFHSLEDRAVKQELRSQRLSGAWDDVARKPVVAGEAELAANPRASSAKLRWARAPLAGASASSGNGSAASATTSHPDQGEET